MRSNIIRFSILVAILMLSITGQVFAGELTGSSREQVFNQLQDAFEGQVSLTEKPRTKEEIIQILSTFFDEELIEKYMSENVHKLDDQYIVYGTDFPIYTIPFFSYNEKTKVFEQANERIIYEYFPASIDGPVEYDDHYEVIKMHKTNDSWKVYSIEIVTEKPEIAIEETRSNDDINNNNKGSQEITDGKGALEQLGSTKNNISQSTFLKKQVVGKTFEKVNHSFKNDLLLFSTFFEQTKSLFNNYFVSNNMDFSD